MDAAAIQLHKVIHSAHQPNIRCAGHLTRGLDPKHNRDTVKKIVAVLRKRMKKGLAFDAIAARGLSGFLFAPIVAMRLKKTLLVVRKGENCHSDMKVEGDYGARSYIILDDFISSGSTVRAITEAITHSVPAARCVGMLCYNDNSSQGWNDVSNLLGNGCNLRGQDERAENILRQNQSFGLEALAQSEFSARQPKPSTPLPGEKVVTFYNYEPLWARI